MSVVDVSGLTYRYGHVTVLHELDLRIPEGVLYALLGPNGCGKTTLLQILMGLRRSQQGRIALFGTERHSLSLRDRSRISYIAEGQVLPGWMRLEQMEAYLAPLYPTWDAALATQLREQFGLDPSRTIHTLSRGEYMKAALLCALAPRPRLLLMDEPFTGMDVLVKDELIRGLLGSAGSEGWTVLLCSHDIGELELLADWAGILAEGRMQLSESLDTLRERCKHVDVVLGDSAGTTDFAIPGDWLNVERSGQRLSFLVMNATTDLERTVLPAHFPDATRIDVAGASLRDVFIAITKRTAALANPRAAA